MLLLTVLLATIPASCIIIYTGASLQDETRNQLLLDAEAQLQQLVNSHTIMAESTQNLLRTLSLSPVIRSGDADAISLFLEELLLTNSYYSTLLVADPAGTVIATGVDRDGYSLHDRPYFLPYNLRRSYYIGHFIVSRSSGLPSLPFLFPVYNPAGDYAGFVLAALNVQEYDHFLQLTDLPRGSSVTIADVGGLILYSSDGTTEIGTAVDKSIDEIITDSSGMGRARYTYTDGTEHLLAFAQLRIDEVADPYLYIMVSIPHEVYFAPIRTITQRNIVLTMLAILLALIISYVLANFGIVHRLNVLTDTARNFTGLDFVPVTDRIHGTDEIGQLAQVFDTMAASVVHRERALRTAIDERDLLLQEVHHRVKNNFQVIASLLSLQMQDIPNDQAAEFLQESRNRVLSMALVHEKFYNSESVGHIDFGSYLYELIGELQQTYFRDDIQVHVSAETASVELDIATPLGLIINEAISNAFKHAFPDNRSGHIYVEFIVKNHSGSVTVKDDGIGLPDDFDPTMVASLGYQLITMLTNQIGAELAIGSDSGTHITVSFPLST